MVELVDTQDLKSCDLKSRAGSIPALSTTRGILKCAMKIAHKNPLVHIAQRLRSAVIQSVVPTSVLT